MVVGQKRQLSVEGGGSDIKRGRARRKRRGEGDGGGGDGGGGGVSRRWLATDNTKIHI